MYWIASNLQDAEFMVRFYPELAWVTYSTLLAGYGWMTLGLVVFCLTAWWLLGRGRWRPLAPLQSAEERHRVGVPLAGLVGAVAAALLAAGLIQSLLGIGLMGQETVVLPLRLNSVLNRFLADMGPGLLLLGLWVFDTRRQRSAWLAALVAIILVGFIQGLSTT